ncbi:MAG: respiratory nitrate reductase subunit gamma [Anaerolineae bacterium]|jgi:nitrate reductase gamma subunit
MATLAFLFYYITPYIAVVVFFGGLAYRVYQWWQRKPVAGHLSLYPRPHRRWGPFMEMLIETVTLKMVFNAIKISGSALPITAGLVLHGALFLALFHHLPVFISLPVVEGTVIWAVFGTIMGLAFLALLLYALAHRMEGRRKSLSVPQDYLALFLLIGIAVTGLHIHLLHTLAPGELPRFFLGLATFHWQPVPQSAGSAFAWHFAFVQLLMVYFPFSKFSHMIGYPLAKMVAYS